MIAILASLLIAGLLAWACCAETPPIARTRDVDEDEPIEWGPGEY